MQRAVTSAWVHCSLRVSVYIYCFLHGETKYTLQAVKYLGRGQPSTHDGDALAAARTRRVDCPDDARSLLE